MEFESILLPGDGCKNASSVKCDLTETLALSKALVDEPLLGRFCKVFFCCFNVLKSVMLYVIYNLLQTCPLQVC